MHIIVVKYMFIFLTVLICINYSNAGKNKLDLSSLAIKSPLDLFSCMYQVNTNSGPVIGCRQGITYTFKGIPFAKPPVGSLRFNKPQPIDKWNTNLFVTDYKSLCIQPITNFNLKYSEDCLYLNVWTPTINPTSNLPVMVYIYGGAFMMGSGSEPMYDGRRLSMEGVVVVNFNYRLGVFGFLYGNRTDAPGNAGLWDQAMALKWTVDNIKGFGGNPNDITVFGESAGSMSTSIHTVSNVTRNLFSKAILQSGTSYGKVLTSDTNNALRVAKAYASNSTLFLSGSCKDDNTWIDCLRRKAWEELLIAQLTSVFWNKDQPWYNALVFPFAPTYGDEFLPISVNQAVKEGNFNTNLKLLIGHTEMEAVTFTTPADKVFNLGGRYDPSLEKAKSISKSLIHNDFVNVLFKSTNYKEEVALKYTDIYNDPLTFEEEKSIRRSAVYAFGDYTLTCPTILYGSHIRQWKSFAGHVYQYRLTYAPSKSSAYQSPWAEVAHGDDVSLVFGIPLLPGEEKNWVENDRIMSQVMVNIWAYFAKYGQPPQVNGNVWPEYGINADNSVNVNYLELNADPNRLGRVFLNRYKGNDGFGPAMIDNCTFWDDIISNEFVYISI